MPSCLERSPTALALWATSGMPAAQPRAPSLSRQGRVADSETRSPRGLFLKVSKSGDPL